MHWDEPQPPLIQVFDSQDCSMQDPGSLTEEGNLDNEGSDPSGNFIRRDLNETPSIAAVANQRDYRLYLPKHAGWEAVIKKNWDQENCYAKNPGEDWFHFLANGEIYIQRGSEKFCLTCALRLKILTRNRIYWEKGAIEPED